MAEHILGVDIGGSGIKAAPVDVVSGQLVAERQRIDTPADGKPDDIIDVIAELAARFGHRGRTGVGYPGVVQQGIVRTAANLHKSWIGVPLGRRLDELIGGPAVVANDADVAGLAEVRFGAGRGVPGVVLMITLGTGIGSGLFVDGRLVPNTEFGHIEVDGFDGESRASADVRDREDLSWKEWGRRVGKYLRTLENLVWPDLIVIGGGVSSKLAKFADELETRTPIVAAAAGNNAGIIGAALVAMPA